MKKRILLLIGYISVMMLCGKVIMGQHGVLLSQSHAHVHDENCEHDCVPPTKEQIVRQEAMLPQVRTQAAIRSVIPPGKGDTSQITPRRTSGGTTGNILGDKDVNNEFGAGETASIGENLQISEPSSGSIVGNLLVPAIQLGSEHSRNVVIHSYNAGGFAAGWINLDIHKRDQSAGGTCDDIGFSGEGTAHFSVGFQHDDIPFAMKENVLYCDSWETDTDINLVYWHHMFANLESATPPIPNKWTSIDSAIRKFPGGIEAFYEHYKNHNIAKNGGLRKVTTQKRYCVIPYTTTFVANPAFTGHAYIKGLTDNGVNLLQVNGDSVRGRAIADNLKLNYGKDPSLHAKEVASPAGGQNSGSLTSFLRPTTVSTVSNTYENIIFKNIDWWYRTYNVNGNYSTGKTNVDYWPCCHNDTVYATPTDIDTWIMLDKQGDTRLDAAVQLINGAVVCVEGDVGDETGSIASKSGDDNVGGKYKETNAMVVVPDSSRWAMRTKGDYHVNIYQEYRTGFSTRNNLKYFAADFPNPSADVYLKGNRPEIPVHHLITYDPVYHLGSYRLGTGADKKIDIPVPADTVGSALFGVYGNYSYDAANGANIHTADAVNNPGVIEVGPQTLGQEKFHVYSGGTIKNFESCNSPANNFPINFGVYGAQNTPAFKIDGDTALYILNYGNNNVNAGYLADINFANDAVANLNNAVSNAGAKGALHIQARGDVRFAGSAPPINMNVTANSNEVRILSDEASILINPAFTFDQADSNLILWAKGANSNSLSRSCITDTGSLQTGMLYFGGSTEITVNGKGLTFFRSEHDDVFFENNLLYKNASTSAVNGEVMIQAGQDIYGSNVDGGKQIKFEQKGEKALLLEAKQTIHTKQDLIFEREQAVAGNIILKAGYASFGDSANINLYSNLSGLWGGAGVKGAPAPHDYGSRAACGSTSGGDIWLEGNAVINLYGSANTIHTVLRAKNSIYIDSGFTCNRSGSGVGGNTVLFAEQGNIEALVDPDVSSVMFTVAQAADTAEIRLQAGNRVWEEGSVNDATIEGASRRTAGMPGAEFDGNILIDKPFGIKHSGLGYTLLSSSRDIENQVHAPMLFDFDNPDRTDSVVLTAGRHVETHAKVLFDFTGTAGPNTGIGDPDYTGNTGEGAYQVLLQAGRLDSATQTASAVSCKIRETGTALVETDGLTPRAMHGTNDFAGGGEGHGSILIFDSLEFKYEGNGAIIMRALNGNIESDPYLHRYDARVANATVAGYDGYANLHNAPVVFNHAGTGPVRLEAIDIKLHDKMEYNGHTADRLKNGRLSIFAFDSVLTRDLSYNNPTDTGSVSIITGKLKRDGNGVAVACGNYDASQGGPGIHQGHIVLGYGADHSAGETGDSIVFNFKDNPNTAGANVYIRAGYDGFYDNPVTGKANSAGLFRNHPDDAGKGYGGNITFDYMKAEMAKGNHAVGGYLEISTPNGNIWGKDSLSFNARNGDLLVDAGTGSLEDTLRATLWSTFSASKNGNGHENILNTCVPFACSNGGEWRTGNIMMKGAVLTFNNGSGNAVFRTREGFIDTYDAFTAAGMEGSLLKYAGMDSPSEARKNNWGDVSERDFRYTPTVNSGSVFFGADDNIMLNYGNSNLTYNNYGSGGAMGYPGNFNADGVNTIADNPYYHTGYEGHIDGLYAAVFDVNTDGYMFYRYGGYAPRRSSHLLYRGCAGADCSGVAGKCKTTSNGARDLTFNFDKDSQGTAIQSGGLAIVASNYIDLFTGFDYFGGRGTGLHTVTGMNSLHGEQVSGYGLYIKSQYNGVGNNSPEKRRATCEGCGVLSSWPVGNTAGNAIPEMTYIGFHDDARIHTQNQISLLEAPVIEFFGHAELDTEKDRGSRTRIIMKSDSLVFHDSVIFDGRGLLLTPFTTDAARRANDMRYGVINDRGSALRNYSDYGPAIVMEDRGLPVLELGYQRCCEPGRTAHGAPNERSTSGRERTPQAGGDVIVAFRHGCSMPIFNTVVANHARISFISDSLDDMPGGEYIDAFIRADLLRIRNKVEFYTDPSQPKDRSGKFMLATPAQMDDQMVDPGMYTRHLHMEPGSELSLPGENSLIVIPTTVVGGYGNIHENVFVKADGILAPGYASLMENDCQTPHEQGVLTMHNLQMEKDAVLRVSVGLRRTIVNGQSVEAILADFISVEDSVFFTDGKVKLEVLPEMESLEEGCYEFITYGDVNGVSKEYVKNFVLATQRYGDSYFALDFSEAGKVCLCVTKFQMPEIQRYVDLPSVEGVTTVPEARRHYVKGYANFEFTATYTGAPLKILATGFYSGRTVNLDKTAKQTGDNTWLYTIYQVVEPWTIFIGPEPSSDVSNGILPEGSQRVWTYRNTLYINASKDDIVSIYNMTGVLQQKIEIPEGIMKFTLERGLYVVTLKDGSVHKIVIR